MPNINYTLLYYKGIYYPITWEEQLQFAYKIPFRFRNEKDSSHRRHVDDESIYDQPDEAYNKPVEPEEPEEPNFIMGHTTIEPEHYNKRKRRPSNDPEFYPPNWSRMPIKEVMVHNIQPNPIFGSPEMTFESPEMIY